MKNVDREKSQPFRSTTGSELPSPTVQWSSPDQPFIVVTVGGGRPRWGRPVDPSLLREAALLLVELIGDAELAVDGEELADHAVRAEGHREPTLRLSDGVDDAAPDVRAQLVTGVVVVALGQVRYP
jgi:hypothetical protein